jgi:hypothetical protein
MGFLVSGDFFPIQIIEAKGLSQADNIWLKGLNNDSLTYISVLSIVVMLLYGG